MGRRLTAAELWDDDDDYAAMGCDSDDGCVIDDDDPCDNEDWNPSQSGGDPLGSVRDPVLLRRRAKLCRDKASETPHVELAEAFIGLAEALELAAYVTDLAAERVLH